MRSRLLKPGFFENETLAGLPPLTRLVFQGLWLIADREGRLEDRPLRIKAQILPYDDCDVNKSLADLDHLGFIRRYQVDGVAYIVVCNFTKHQWVHPHEAASVIPPCPKIVEQNQCQGLSGKIQDITSNVTDDYVECQSSALSLSSSFSSSLSDNDLLRKSAQSDVPRHSRPDVSKCPKVQKSESSTEYHARYMAWATEQINAFIGNGNKDQLAIAYPGVNLGQEAARALVWLQANPGKRKKDLTRFMNNWLARGQERRPRSSDSWNDPDPAKPRKTMDQHIAESMERDKQRERERLARVQAREEETKRREIERARLREAGLR